MKVICKYNDPTNLPDGISDDFDFGLKLESEYLVMGIVMYHGSSNIYYLVDEEGKPNWFPSELFAITDNSLPENWYIRINREQNKSDIFSIYSFNELCNDENYYDHLINREKNALKIYFDWKRSY